MSIAKVLLANAILAGNRASGLLVDDHVPAAIEPLKVPAAAWEIMDDVQKQRAQEVANESHNGLIEFVDGKIPDSLRRDIERDKHRRAAKPRRDRYYEALKFYTTEKAGGKAAERRRRQLERSRG